ncbi:MAG: DUF2961 domain-containing protein [Bacteroidales bacterium]|nr:DUF2961 domain-containing protein [Bacteroidales bacterium]
MNLCNINGEGVINRFWCTYLPTTEEVNNYLGRALVLNIYWDGSETPAVSAPFADFFCQPMKLQAIDNHFFNSSTEKEILFWFGADVEFKKLNNNSLYLHA